MCQYMESFCATWAVCQYMKLYCALWLQRSKNKFIIRNIASYVNMSQYGFISRHVISRYAMLFHMLTYDSYRVIWFHITIYEFMMRNFVSYVNTGFLLGNMIPFVNIWFLLRKKFHISTDKNILLIINPHMGI